MTNKIVVLWPGMWALKESIGHLTYNKHNSVDINLRPLFLMQTLTPTKRLQAGILTLSNLSSNYSFHTILYIAIKNLISELI
jgi:hypothetical protein